MDHLSWLDLFSFLCFEDVKQQAASSVSEHPDAT